jgi:inner membrane protease subunit 2
MFKSSSLIPVVKSGIVGFAAMWLTTEYVGSWGVVHGRSMQPQFNNRFDDTLKDIVVYHRFTRLMDRGDVVIFRSPLDQRRFLIKRVLGLPGDRVKNLDNETVEIPDGHCWLEGDNSFHSRDSNWYGPIPMKNVTGVVTHTIYPHLERVSDHIPENRVNIDEEQQTM